MQKVESEPDAIGQEKLSEEAEENLKQYLMIVLEIFEELQKNESAERDTRGADGS